MNTLVVSLPEGIEGLLTYLCDDLGVDETTFLTALIENAVSQIIFEDSGLIAAYALEDECGGFIVHTVKEQTLRDYLTREDELDDLDD